MTQEETKERCARYLDATLSLQEERELHDLLSAKADLTEDERLVLQLMEVEFPDDSEDIAAQCGQGPRRLVVIRWKAVWWLLPVAAAMLVLLALSPVLFFQKDGRNTENLQTASSHQPAHALSDSIRNAEVAPDTIASPRPVKGRKPRRTRRRQSLPLSPKMDMPLLAMGDTVPETSGLMAEVNWQEADRLAGEELAWMEAQQKEGLRLYELAIAETYDLMTNQLMADGEDSEDENNESF